MHTLIGHGVSKQLENQSHVSIKSLNLDFPKVKLLIIYITQPTYIPDN